MPMFKRKTQQPAVSPLPAPPTSASGRTSMSSLASTQAMHGPGSSVERVQSRQSRMSVGTMDSHATVTDTGKRRSGGFLGFGRKKDRKVDEEDEAKNQQQRQSFSVSGRPSGGPIPEGHPMQQRPMSQQMAPNGRVLSPQQQHQRGDFGPAPPGQHARAQSLGANTALGQPPMPRAASGDAARGTPPQSPGFGRMPAGAGAAIGGNDPQWREAFEPVVELISYQPHKTYVASPPELEMIFARTSAGQQPRQGAPGSPSNDWDAVWLQLSGTSLSMWSMKETRAAAAAGTKVPPTYFNITESTLELLSPLPPPPHRPNSHPHKHVFSLNTAGSNRLLFSCPTDRDLIRWTTGLRLAAWERSRLEEIYTGHLIQAQRREPRSPLVGGRFEGWVRVRVMGGIEWHRLWLVLSDPATLTPESANTQGRRRSSFFGLHSEKNETIQEPNTGVPMASFYNEPRTAKNRTSSLPVLTVTNVTQAYAMFPERLEVISQSNLMKVVGRVSGDLVTIEGGLRESGWAMIMPETPVEEAAASPTSPLGVMMRWVTAFHDAFQLYGRPNQYAWNENDPKSLFFGYPRGEFRGDLFLSMDEAVRANQRLNTPGIRAQFVGLMQRRLSQRHRVDQVNDSAIEEEEETPKLAQERAYIREAQALSTAEQQQQQAQTSQQNGHDQSFTLPPLQFSEDGDQETTPRTGHGAGMAAAGAGALAAGGAAAALYAHDDHDPRSLTPITESDASRQNSARRPPGAGDMGPDAGVPAVRQTGRANSPPHAYQPEPQPGQQTWGQQNQSRAPVQPRTEQPAPTSTQPLSTGQQQSRPMSMGTFGIREDSETILSPAVMSASPINTMSPSRGTSERQATVHSEDSQPTVWSQPSGPSSAVTPKTSMLSSGSATPPGDIPPITDFGRRDSTPAAPGAYPNGTPQPSTGFTTTIPDSDITPPAGQQYPSQADAPSSPPTNAQNLPSQSSHSHHTAAGAGLAAGAAALGTAALGTAAYAHQRQGQSQSPPREGTPTDGTLHQPRPSRSQRMSMTEVPGLREEPAAMYLMNMVEEPAPAPVQQQQPQQNRQVPMAAAAQQGIAAQQGSLAQQKQNLSPRLGSLGLQNTAAQQSRSPRQDSLGLDTTAQQGMPAQQAPAPPAQPGVTSPSMRAAVAAAPLPPAHAPASPERAAAAPLQPAHAPGSPERAPPAEVAASVQPAPVSAAAPRSPTTAAAPVMAAPAAAAMSSAPALAQSTREAVPHGSPPSSFATRETRPSTLPNYFNRGPATATAAQSKAGSAQASTSNAIPAAAAGVGAAAVGAAAAAAAMHSRSPPRNQSRSPPTGSAQDKPSRPSVVTSFDQQHQQHTRAGVVRKPSGARAQQSLQQPLNAVRTSSSGSAEREVPVSIQENVEVGRNATTTSGTAMDDGRVMASPPNNVNTITSPSSTSPTRAINTNKMHDLAPESAAYLAYADEPTHQQNRAKLPSPPQQPLAQQSQEPRSSFAPSKQAAERRAKAEAAAAEQQRTMAMPGAGRQKIGQKPDNWDGSDDDESDEDEEGAMHSPTGPAPAPERRGSRALPSLPQSQSQPPQINQPAYLQQQQPHQPQYNQQQQHFYAGGAGAGANGDRFEPPSMNNLSINDPRYDRPRSRSPPAPHRHLPPQPHQPPAQEREREPQRAAPLPAPPAAKQNVWNANFAMEHGMDRKGTFVELEEPQVALTKAFTPGGLIQAGMQDKQDRSAKRQEEVARETGSALVNVPEPPPPPQTGLVGAVAAHERERKSAGGIGATLTDRDRERRLAEERQRKIDELQRQQMEHMQQQYAAGGMYPGQFPPQFGGYGMPPMGYPYGMMNPAAQQQAMMAAQMAYQQTIMAMSAAGSQAGDNDGRTSPASMRMSPQAFQPMGMPGYGGGFGMPPQSMYGGFPGYGMPGMPGPGSAWGSPPQNYGQTLQGGAHSPAGGGSYPGSERGEERQDRQAS